MELNIRIAVSLALLGTVSLGAIHFDQRFVTRMALDFCRLPNNYLKVEREREREDQIHELQRVMRERLERKAQIATAVLEGRLSLQKAADMFWEAGKDAPYDWYGELGQLTTSSRRKNCAYFVIEDIEMLLRSEQKGNATLTATALRAEVASWTDQ